MESSKKENRDLKKFERLAAELEASAKDKEPFVLGIDEADGREELQWLNDNELLDWLAINESFEQSWT